MSREGGVVMTGLLLLIGITPYTDVSHRLVLHERQEHFGKPVVVGDTFETGLGECENLTAFLGLVAYER